MSSIYHVPNTAESLAGVIYVFLTPQKHPVNEAVLPILQMGKLGLSKVQWPAQDHPAR